MKNDGVEGVEGVFGPVPAGTDDVTTSGVVFVRSSFL